MTIEERADKIYDAGSGAIESIALNSMAKKDYIKGAEDQRKLDIKKASLWLFNNAISLNLPKYCTSTEYISILDEFIKRFEKGMEEDEE